MLFWWRCLETLFVQRFWFLWLFVRLLADEPSSLRFGHREKSHGDAIFKIQTSIEDPSQEKKKNKHTRNTHESLRRRQSIFVLVYSQMSNRKRRERERVSRVSRERESQEYQEREQRERQRDKQNEHNRSSTFTRVYWQTMTSYSFGCFAVECCIYIDHVWLLHPIRNIGLTR